VKEKIKWADIGRGKNICGPYADQEQGGERFVMRKEKSRSKKENDNKNTYGVVKNKTARIAESKNAIVRKKKKKAKIGRRKKREALIEGGLKEGGKRTTRQKET